MCFLPGQKQNPNYLLFSGGPVLAPNRAKENTRVTVLWGRLGTFPLCLQRGPGSRQKTGKEKRAKGNTIIIRFLDFGLLAAVLPVFFLPESVSCPGKENTFK